MNRMGMVIRKLYDEDINNVSSKSNVNRLLNNKKLDFIPASKKKIIIYSLLGLLVLALLLETIYMFNAFSTLGTTAQALKANINQELRRRNNLIPNLTFSVEKYALYEQHVFKSVSNSREALKNCW